MTGITSNSHWQSDVYQILDDYLHNPAATSFDKQNENILEKKNICFCRKAQREALIAPIVHFIAFNSSKYVFYNI